MLLGGSGSLGPLEEVHLLENPAITAGLVQEQKLLLARRELVEVQERAVQLQAQLSSMTLERDRAMDQQQVPPHASKQEQVQLRSIRLFQIA